VSVAMAILSRMTYVLIGVCAVLVVVIVAMLVIQ
jgi:uncharacterized membrane protein YuzA (DUF378 family)